MALLKKTLYIVFCTVLFVFCLVPHVFQSLPGFRIAYNRIYNTAISEKTQWALTVCIVYYAFCFFFLNNKFASNSKPLRGRWLSSLFWVIAVGYATLWSFLGGQQTTDFLTFISGIALGQGVIYIGQFTGLNKEFIFRASLSTMVFVIALVSHYGYSQPGSNYRGVIRLEGPFGNPNLFGLLMGVGLVSSLGLITHYIYRERDYFKAICFACCFCYFGIGLYGSFSRGAWLASGIAFLLYIKKHISLKTWRISCLFIFVFAAFCFAIFWPSKGFENHLLRRCFSVVNFNDFSWRNRVSTYEGSLQLISDFMEGAKWGVSENYYRDFYQPLRIYEVNVSVNSFVFLAVTCGIGTMFSVMGYGFLAIKSGLRLDSLYSADLRASAAGGVVILMVGFWFEGGIFSLPLGFTYWLFAQLCFFASDQNDEHTPIVSISPSRLGSLIKRLNKVWLKTYRRWLLFSLLVCLTLLIPLVQILLIKSKHPSAIQLRDVSSDFLCCVWISEDHRFFQHHGFDWKEIKAARAEAKKTGKPARGASTITQQCARSLFLWQGRSWVRKGLEAYYTFWMELLLSKRRILELYVNVIELGDGIYGLEAAAQHYYNVPSKDLTREQAAMLVAIMPNPREWNPLAPNERVKKRQAVILKRSENVKLPLDLEEKK